MVAGLIHDIPTVQELIDRIMAEADAIIAQRLARFAGLGGAGSSGRETTS
jgi:nitronate monooxygenase